MYVSRSGFFVKIDSEIQKFTSAVVSCRAGRRSLFFFLSEKTDRGARVITRGRAPGVACRRGSRAVATPRRVGDDVAMLRVHGVHGGEERGTCPAHRRRARFEMRHVRWSSCRPGPRFFSFREMSTDVPSRRTVARRDAKSRHARNANARHNVHAKAPRHAI